MITSIIFGFISGSTLFFGALLGIYLKVSTKITGAIMAFGSGVLISALTFDLMENAFQLGGFDSVAIGFVVGTLLYVVGDYFIDHFGGHFRKRLHGEIHSTKKKAQQKAKPGKTSNNSSKVSDSGSAILLGAVLDGIPESMAIGIGLAAGQGVGLSMMIAVFISNLPEGISGAKGMKAAGKSNLHIMVVWGITIATAVISTILGYALFANAAPDVIAFTYSIAAGAILSMIADTMMPEAFEDGGRFVALATAVGFFIAFVVNHLAG